MLCTSITSSDISACRAIIQCSEMVELRLDLMLLSPAQIQALVRETNVPVVATCREGKYTSAERKLLLQHAIECGATYVDIEVEADAQYQKDLAAFAKMHRCKVIISYHNFEQTPDMPTLRSIIAACNSKGADMVKLITTAHSASDCARILSLYNGLQNQNLIAFAMGESGKITRLACLYLGAPFTYVASDDGCEAAPGQISAKNLRQIQSLLCKSASTTAAAASTTTGTRSAMQAS